jgi:hypothetical protein
MAYLRDSFEKKGKKLKKDGVGVWPFQPST